MQDKKLSPAALGIGGAAGVIAALVVMILYSVMTVRMQSVEAGMFVPVMMAALGVGAMAGGFVCAKLTKQCGMMNGALCAGIVFVLMVLIVLLTGAVPTVQVLLRLALMLPMGALGGVLGVNVKKKRKRRK